MIEAQCLIVAVEEDTLNAEFKEELHVIVQIVKHRVCLKILLEQVVPYIDIVADVAPAPEPVGKGVVIDYLKIGHRVQIVLFNTFSASELVGGAVAVRSICHAHVVV